VGGVGWHRARLPLPLRLSTRTGCMVSLTGSTTLALGRRLVPRVFPDACSTRLSNFFCHVSCTHTLQVDRLQSMGEALSRCQAAATHPMT